MRRGDYLYWGMWALIAALVVLAGQCGAAHAQPGSYFDLDLRLQRLERNAALSQYLPGRITGNLQLDGAIRIPKGAAAGLVLQSDGAGNATWGTFNGGGGDGDSLYFFLPGRSWTGGQTGYGSNTSSGDLKLIGNTGPNSPQFQMLSIDNTMHLVGGTSGSVFIHGRLSNSTQPVEFGGGVDNSAVTVPGTVLIHGGGGASHTSAQLTVDESSGAGFGNQFLIQVKGQAAQVMAAGVGGMYESYFAGPPATATANHMAFWAPGTTPSINPPTTFFDKNGTFHGPVAGGTVLSYPSPLSVTDSAFTIANQADTTKKIKFYASQVTTGNTRRFFLQDYATGILALTDRANAFSASNTFTGLSNIFGSALTPIETRLYTDANSQDANGLNFVDINAGGGCVMKARASSTATHYVQTPYNGGMVVVSGDGVDNLSAVDAVAQSAAIAATNLTTGSPSGYYVVHYTIEAVTQQAGAATVQFQINYTDDIGATTQTGTAINLITAGTPIRDRGSFQIYLASGQVTYQTNVTGVIGLGRYTLRARIIAL